MGFSILDSIREAKTTDTENNKVLLEAPDDDFSIDTTLDTGDDSDDSADDLTTDDGSTDDALGGDADLGDDSGDADTSDIGGSDTTGEDDTSDAAVEDNADLFSSLTAQEQQIKIDELKKLFNTMYSSFDDICNKINKIDIEEYNKTKMTKITYIVMDLKQYIADYILKVFPQRSYFENDVAYNRFLDIIYTINKVLDKVLSEKNKYMEENQ